MPSHWEYHLTLCDREELDANHVVLTFIGPEIAAAAQPGQFVSLACSRFLRRPFGIMAVERETDRFQVGIRRQGEGSNELADLQPGAEVSILGPLGNGFKIESDRQIITVGGGTGVFPLLFVHQACSEREIPHLAVCGYRSSEDSILLEEFAETADSCLFASDSGGLDMTGNAAEALEQVLTIMDEAERFSSVVLACGPEPMLKLVAEVCTRNKVECQVSLESRMACGFGVCLCCAVATERDGEARHERCCVEGPVFPAEAIQWK
ncbi:MAG: dihydroorotate dehydrogenase electron transfer subunit [Saccharofermentanales bacterium]